MNKIFNPFREALKHLRTSNDLDRGFHPLHKDNENFVCWALDCVKDNQKSIEQGRHNSALCDAAQYHIRDLLVGQATVINWLQRYSPEYRSIRNEYDRGRMLHRLLQDLQQAYRWRWTLSMAAEYDAGKNNFIKQYMIDLGRKNMGVED
ncbi:hypothetical protein [Delftia phage PhiW-14]|uniref:Uncharacterized protein n=1 Tax=Delftia phage PhiW-14 TaxID=665032 RepID=C9DGE6_BPW14|nr:hypothetical protein DP-phiW-14_gp176 [Delftia phage PhiW-14]ACV50197.1 hypothetical protein [Delftia phage PhiW-14]